MKVLVTGNAGFIGYHVAKRFLERGDEVVGFDCVNAYYDPGLKEARLRLLEGLGGKGSYSFVRADLAERSQVDACFSAHRFDRVVHLAAQAGVRHSLENPYAYIQSNLVAFANILEACRRNDVAHLTYAGSSSVYGGNATLPYSEHQAVDHPLQLYAATKRSNELMAHAYSHLYGLPTTGLRFFTVYGPWGRPDMALFLFTKSVLAGAPINLYNGGDHMRDFTYIDDIVEGVVRVSDKLATPSADWDPLRPDPATSSAPYRILNIGNSQPVQLLDYVRALEVALGKSAVVQQQPLQPGDMRETYADVSELEKWVGYRPSIEINEGVKRFVDWYRSYFAT
jgi:UDP-glucuronate 4-epimerase